MIKDCIYNKLYKYLKNVCRKFSIDDDTINEYVQLAMVKIFLNIDKIEQMDNIEMIKSYSYTILKNCINDIHRSKYNRLVTTSSILENIIIADVDDTDNYINKINILNKLHEEIDKLRPRFKMNAQLYFIDNLKHSEIAEVMGINVSTSKTNIMKIKRKLKEKVNIK